MRSAISKHLLTVPKSARLNRSQVVINPKERERDWITEPMMTTRSMLSANRNLAEMDPILQS